jgi:hypothetical protein
MTPKAKKPHDRTSLRLNVLLSECEQADKLIGVYLIRETLEV